MKDTQRTFEAKRKETVRRVAQLERAPLTRIRAGTVVAFAGVGLPAGYKLCDGAYYDREDEVVLFNAIGTTFGTTTASNFRVPTIPNLAAGVRYLVKA